MCICVKVSCVLSLVGRLQDVSLVAEVPVRWPTHLMVPRCNLLQHIVLVTQTHTIKVLINRRAAVSAEETVYSADIEPLLTDWLIDWASDWLIGGLHWTGCIHLCGPAVYPAGRALGWQRATAGRTSPRAGSQSAAGERLVGGTPPWQRTRGGRKDTQTLIHTITVYSSDRTCGGWQKGNDMAQGCIWCGS